MCNNGVGQFKPIFHVEGNTFRPIVLQLEFFRQLNFVTDFIQLNLNFIPKNFEKSVFEPPFGVLRGNIHTRSIARWIPMVDFLFVISEFCLYLLWLRHYKRRSVEVGVFRSGWVTLRLNFMLNGYFSHQSECVGFNVPLDT